MKELEDWLAALTRRHHKEIDLDLRRCGTVYRRLGSPRPARKIVSVAGTNGKGSTVAYLAAMSAGLGQRVGSYTSPHILRFNERICVQGQAVTDSCLVQAFAQVEAARAGVSLTYFEFTTLAALVILQQSKLDCAVLEVGLGGRLDAVNLVDADCAVITAIGLDHQDYLGADIASIATEKAGIMRASTAVVCSEQQPPAAIIRVAADMQAPVYRRNADFSIGFDPGDDVGMLKFVMGDATLSVCPPRMCGKHQLDNLAGALAALLLLNPGADKRQDSISTSIAGCVLPGRLQRIHTAPAILVDVGHNELAAEAVVAHLRASGVVTAACVLAMLADKPAAAVASALAPVCSHWLCVDSHGGRGQRGRQLAQRVQAALPAADVQSHAHFDAAMESATVQVGSSGTILVFGSFSVVSDASQWLRNGLQHKPLDAAKIT